MKLKIKDLEDKIGYKIKRNFKAIGFDTAKTCGIGFAKTTRTHIHLDWCYLQFENSSQEELLKRMYKEFGKLITNEDFAVIEEVFLGFSRAGSLHLAKMGTMAIAQCVQKNVDFKLISAVSARSKFKINTKKYGKGKSKLAVKDWLQSVGLIIDEDNCADGVVLALIGICEDIDFSSKKKKKHKKKS